MLSSTFQGHFLMLLCVLANARFILIVALSLTHLNGRDGSQYPQVVDHQETVRLRETCHMSVDSASTRQTASHQLKENDVDIKILVAFTI